MVNFLEMIKDKVKGSSDNYYNNCDYQSLMSNRIRNIMLICNSYDGFSLEEDGRIESQISQEYNELNMSNPPEIKRVKSTIEALELLKTSSKFDLIITMYNVGELDPFSFSKIVKETYPDIAIVLLTSFSRVIHQRIEEQDTSTIDYMFYWHGSADLIIAIIKLIEDQKNAEHDILKVGVQAILLVEDSVRYYSTYLPAIIKLILQQSTESHEALNEQQQKFSKRARPKLLMATNYSDAVALYKKYKNNLLGVISDVGFVINKGDKPETEKLDAGIDLCKMIKKDNPLMPFILQSSQKSMAKVARELEVKFIVKNSKTLLIELNDYISSEFAFGEFQFRDPDTGNIIARAKDLHELQLAASEIPEKLLINLASQNLLSKWMLSRGLFTLGEEFKKINLSDFDSANDMREYIKKRINNYRIAMGQGVVAKFDKDSYDDTIWFARIGSGSLGGKARGLAFLNRMLQKYNTYEKYKGVRVSIPRTVVIATDFFDEFIRENGLKYVINSDVSDEEILSEFVSSRLPQSLIENLKVFIKYIKNPLAIRSSSKLEDSYYQPFAGIYSTYMIPLTDESQMLRLLSKAIKSVYSSIYYASSRSYITATSNVISEEKMAIVLQEVCGSEDSGFFFPTISGVARSLNFYPIGEEKPEDGVAKIAFGLGKAVVDGEQSLMFIPKYPKKVLQLSTPEMALRDTQHVVYALDLMPEKFKISIDDSINIRRFDVSETKDFRNIRHVASIWDMQNGIISDTPFGNGRQVITFSHILKYDSFPFAKIVRDMLNLYQSEMQSPIEIEFAVNMDVPEGDKIIFNLLQIRPIASESDNVKLNWNKEDIEGGVLYSESVLGKGIIQDISDVIYVKKEKFNPLVTNEIAGEIAEFNLKMKNVERGYILIGPGRWGSKVPSLGIPVGWAQISEVKLLVECEQKNFRVEPSQGTHFFQNMTSLGVGYMTVNPFNGKDYYDEEILNSMPAENETEYIRHVRFKKPLYVFIDSINNKGLVKSVNQ